DQDAAPLLDGRGLHDGAQGVGGTAALADDLAVVVVRDGELEDDSPVVLVELLDLDLVRLVDELTGEVLQQLLHRSRSRPRCPGCAAACGPARWAVRPWTASRARAPRRPWWSTGRSASCTGRGSRSRARRAGSAARPRRRARSAPSSHPHG